MRLSSLIIWHKHAPECSLSILQSLVTKIHITTNLYWTGGRFEYYSLLYMTNNFKILPIFCQNWLLKTTVVIFIQSIVTYYMIGFQLPFMIFFIVNLGLTYDSQSHCNGSNGMNLLIMIVQTWNNGTIKIIMVVKTVIIKKTKKTITKKSIILCRREFTKSHVRERVT